MRIQLDLLTRILIVVALISALGSIPMIVLVPFEWTEKALIAGSTVLVSMLLARYLLRDIREGLTALEMGLLNLKDGEFSTTLAYQNKDELGQLCELYNKTAHQLRDEKHWLYQRELLLDKVTQSSPEVLFLVNADQQVIFSNIAARRFFECPNGLDGQLLNDLYPNAPAGVEAIVNTRKEGLFSLSPNENEPETWHMSLGYFTLNNQSHVLYILKQMTRELSRQEVAVWKKVIRVISHELNNSLGPISSMLHSGKILSQKLDEERLTRVFSTIDERIKHLSEFVQGYGKFAKLPEPKITPIKWQGLLSQLSAQWQFIYDKEQQATIAADPVQLEQLLINLLKNAHESGSSASDVAIELQSNANEVCIKVIDGGKGMSDSVMQSALIPFYSTKPTGSGLGLALCREIVDAHHGHLALHNRETGGLIVRITLPALSSKQLNDDVV
jgi:two-component system nitrogen regulation sensor histidine kinase NtrY